LDIYFVCFNNLKVLSLKVILSYKITIQYTIPTFIHLLHTGAIILGT